MKRVILHSAPYIGMKINLCTCPDRDNRVVKLVYASNNLRIKASCGCWFLVDTS